MADKRKSSYSWKTPWAFSSLYHMRRRLSERFVYKKLGLLERHSSFKKPYLQRGPHKIGELDYSYPNWKVPPWAGGGKTPYPGGGGGNPPEIDQPDPDQWVCEECELLGPGTAQCGEAWQGQVVPSECAGFTQFAMGLDGNEDFDIAGDSSGAIIVVVPEGTKESSMLVCNSGGLHGATCCMEVRISCPCCEVFTVVADQSTVNKGDIASFTISPPCPGATCVGVSNSGCSVPCSINAAGSSASVDTTNMCGSFTVTVSSEGTEDCDALEATGDYVRIADDGSWELCDAGGEGGLCNGPWCNSAVYTGKLWIQTNCKAGGICARDRYWATEACGGGPGPTIDCVAGCCDGCGTCETAYAYCSWAVYEWNCSC